MAFNLCPQKEGVMLYETEREGQRWHCSSLRARNVALCEEEMAFLFFQNVWDSFRTKMRLIFFSKSVHHYFTKVKSVWNLLNICVCHFVMKATVEFSSPHVFMLLIFCIVLPAPFIFLSSCHLVNTASPQLRKICSCQEHVGNYISNGA